MVSIIARYHDGTSCKQNTTLPVIRTLTGILFGAKEAHVLAKVCQSRERPGILCRPDGGGGTRGGRLCLGVMHQTNCDAIRQTEGPKISPIGIALYRRRQERKVGRRRLAGAAVSGGIFGAHGGRAYADAARSTS